MSQKVEIIFENGGISHLKVWRETRKDTNMYLLSPGDVCVIAPFDPLHKKHHGRHCKISKFIENKSSKFGVAVEVTFLDTPEKDEVAPIDLVPISVE